MDNAVFDREKRLETPLYCIGRGFRGSVWGCFDATQGSVAFKCEDGKDGGQGSYLSLQDESDMHRHIREVWDRRPDYFDVFAIPEWYGYVSEQDARALLPRFPQGHNPCNMLLTERIQPIPIDLRCTLIDMFCPLEEVPSVAANPENHQCLVRPYLGMRRNSFQRTDRDFTLRNYPLHLDQMEEMDFDIDNYSLRIARTLAFMYWAAKVDMNDVEFVIGGKPSAKYGLPLWILDFDCCRTITMDTTGLEQAAGAF
ncbi:hypothetical protein HD806DRAFT_550458 [Xylariaceae sp. AK1471]|nr:hypothetical protein HD806DRAFT_550458 [Xylariaceae sp. AK1471]